MAKRESRAAQARAADRAATGKATGRSATGRRYVKWNQHVLPQQMQRRSAKFAKVRAASPRKAGVLPDDEAQLRAFIERSTDKSRKRRAEQKLLKLRLLREREAKALGEGLSGQAKSQRRRPVEAIDVEAAVAGVPSLNHDVAYEFAKLLVAGLPSVDAIVHVSGKDIPVPIAQRVAAGWLRHPYVLEAVTALNGQARWEDLTPEQRMTVALDKHMAELAYVLYTNSIADPRVSPKLLTEARNAITERLAGNIDANSPFNQFLAALKKGEARLKARDDQDVQALPQAVGMVDPPHESRGTTGRGKVVAKGKVVSIAAARTATAQTRRNTRKR